MNLNVIHSGDATYILQHELPSKFAQCCITSPPYWGLRNYQASGQLGMEQEPSEYINKLLYVFRAVYDALRDDGTLWVVIGDSYAGSGKTGGNPNHTQFGEVVSDQLQGTHGIVPQGCKPKDLIGIPWMLAFALREQGWYLRQDIIWHKPNPMPNPVKDRCTSAHEYIFLLSKNREYYYNADAIKTNSIESASNIKFGGSKYDPENSTNSTYSNRPYNNTGKANKRDVWTVPTASNGTIHKAPYPEDLIRPMVLAGSKEDSIILDPFMGSGTTGIVARELQRNFVGIDINPEFCQLASERCKNVSQATYLAKLRRKLDRT